MNINRSIFFLFKLILLNISITGCEKKSTSPNNNINTTNTTSGIEYFSKNNNIPLYDPMSRYEIAEDKNGNIWISDLQKIYCIKNNLIYRVYATTNANAKSDFSSPFVKSDDGELFIHGASGVNDKGYLYKTNNGDLSVFLESSLLGYQPYIKYMFLNKNRDLEVNESGYYYKVNPFNKLVSNGSFQYKWDLGVFDGVYYWTILKNELYKNNVRINPTIKNYTQLKCLNGVVFAFKGALGIDIFKNNQWNFLNSTSPNWPTNFSSLCFDVDNIGNVYLGGAIIEFGTGEITSVLLKIGTDGKIVKLNLNREFLDISRGIYKVFVDSKNQAWLIYLNEFAEINVAKMKL